MFKNQANSKNYKNRFHFLQSLQMKILIPFLLLFVLTGGVIAFVSYNFSAKTTEKQLTNNMAMQTDSLNDTFGLFFDNITNTLDRVSDNPLIINHQEGETDDLFQYL